MIVNCKQIYCTPNHSFFHASPISFQNFQKLLDEFPEMHCKLETIALFRLNLLGKEPKPDQIKKQISTTIPPPHISKDASHSQDDTLMQCNHVAECACYHPTPKEQEDTSDIVLLHPTNCRRITTVKQINFHLLISMPHLNTLFLLLMDKGLKIAPIPRPDIKTICL